MPPHGHTVSPQVPPQDLTGPVVVVVVTVVALVATVVVVTVAELVVVVVVVAVATVVDVTGMHNVDDIAKHASMGYGALR